jgi:sterol desaturase/sphingolipid hydroxylase (fatty acid hydroxylase superfamily)
MKMNLFTLEHSRQAYRADFALYAATSLVMGITLLMASPKGQSALLFLVAWGGLLTWPLIEYSLHRFVLHGLKPFSTWHAAHHQRPHALICTPTILSASLIAVLVFVPAWWLSNLWLALALTFGLLNGYLVYAITHHAIHHWRSPNEWIRQRKHCHTLHHDPRRPAGFYGVTSVLWDEVLGTKHHSNW